IFFRPDVLNGENAWANSLECPSPRLKSEMRRGKSLLPRGKSEMRRRKSLFPRRKSEMRRGKSLFPRRKSEISRGEATLARQCRPTVRAADSRSSYHRLDQALLGPEGFPTAERRIAPANFSYFFL